MATVAPPGAERRVSMATVLAAALVAPVLSAALASAVSVSPSALLESVFLDGCRTCSAALPFGTVCREG